MVKFERHPCPVCGHLRPDNQSGCPECGWRKEGSGARKKQLQFNLATLLDFMIIVGFASLGLKVLIWLVTNAGFYGTLFIIVTLAAFAWPWVALYRWWANIN